MATHLFITHCSNPVWDLQGIWGCGSTVATLGLDQCLRIWRLLHWNATNHELSGTPGPSGSRDIAEVGLAFVQTPEPAVLSVLLDSHRKALVLAAAGRGVQVLELSQEAQGDDLRRVW